MTQRFRRGSIASSGARRATGDEGAGAIQRFGIGFAPDKRQGLRKALAELERSAIAIDIAKEQVLSTRESLIAVEQGCAALRRGELVARLVELLLEAGRGAELVLLGLPAGRDRGGLLLEVGQLLGREHLLELRGGLTRL